MYTNGTAKIIDFEPLYAWLDGLSHEDAENFRGRVKEAYVRDFCDQNHYEYDNAKHFAIREYDKTPLGNALRKNFTEHGGWCGMDGRESVWRKSVAETVDRYRAFEMFAKEFQQEIHVGYWLEHVFAFLYLGNADSGIVVPDPEVYLEYVPARDREYRGMTPAQVRAMLGGTDSASEIGLMPVSEQQSVTRQGLEDALDCDKAELDRLKGEIEKVKRAEEGELAELRKEIERKTAELNAKKDAMLAELNEKKAVMEIQIEEFGTKVYMLEAQIYAIECYAGDVIRFAHICKGKNAPDTEPLVIYQKFRFLDEELGKLASLYEIQWDEIGLFEKFLQHHPMGLDTFAPSERCVTIVRLSRTGKTIGFGESYPYTNLLDAYEYYHGTTVGVIIRNGENVYLGWTEEKKVHLDDNLVFGSDSAINKPTMEAPPVFDTAVERLDYVKKQVKEAKAYTDEIINRAFIFNILQGVIDHSELLPMPEPVNLMKPSPYVVFSMADNWLKDTRFGSFTEILEKCQRDPREGDAILTVQRIVPERRPGKMWDETWHNSRGIGERNRTHDVHADDNEIYPINKIVWEQVPTVRYRIVDDDGVEHILTTDSFTANPDGTYEVPRYSRKRFTEKLETEVLEFFHAPEPHIYISLQKTDSKFFRNIDARANFELEKEEFINLTYLNSVVLEWVIHNRELGDWHIGGQKVSYAYGIKYLKNALEYVRVREADEKDLINAVDPAVCEDPDWPLKLSDWKMEHKVHTMTPYQAKRFVKWFRSNPKGH